MPNQIHLGAFPKNDISKPSLNNITKLPFVKFILIYWLSDSIFAE